MQQVVVADAKILHAMIVVVPTRVLEWPTATVVQVEQALVKTVAMIRLHYLDYSATTVAP